MEFTLFSGNVPIATTDLGFMHFGGPNRSGWLHPKPNGEKILERIASPLPAMRAYLMRDIRSSDGKSIVRPEYLESELFADLAAQVQHTTALDLTLRREDGSLLAATQIGIQDVEVLGEIGRLTVQRMDEEEEMRGWQPEDSIDEVEPEGSDAFVTIIDGETGEARPWDPEDFEIEPSPSRYQIHVMLADERDLPGTRVPLP